MMGLTRKQRDLLDFIGERMAVDGVCPSYEEMKDGIGLKAKSGIHRLITELEYRGFIRRLPYRARALEILETPPPRLRPVLSRPLLSEDTETLIAEIETRGFQVSRVAA